MLRRRSVPSEVIRRYCSFLMTKISADTVTRRSLFINQRYSATTKTKTGKFFTQTFFEAAEQHDVFRSFSRIGLACVGFSYEIVQKFLKAEICVCLL